ncbi:hypothetical protein Aperf_G00000072817 [Anoplocephala perfoliata]
MKYRFAENKTRRNDLRRKDNDGSGVQKTYSTFSKPEEIPKIDEVGVNDAENEDEYVNGNPETFTDSENEGNSDGDEQDMEYCLSLLAQTLYPQFSQRIQQYCLGDIGGDYRRGDIGTEVGGTDGNQGEVEGPNRAMDLKKRGDYQVCTEASADRSINGEGEDSKIVLNFDYEDEESCGEEEDMKHCLLLFAQVLYPEYAQYIQECCGTSNNLSTSQMETEGVKEETFTSIEGFCNERTDEIDTQISDYMDESTIDKSINDEGYAGDENAKVSEDDDYDDEVYGSEKDMKQCLLLIAQKLFPQYAQFFHRCCGSSSISEEDTESNGVFDSQRDGETEEGESDSDDEAIADQFEIGDAGESDEDTMSESYGNEEDMKQCLLLLAKMLFPQFAKHFQQFSGNDNSNGDSESIDDSSNDYQTEELASNAMTISWDESAGWSSEQQNGICIIEESADNLMNGDGAEDERSDIDDVNIESICDKSEVDDEELKQCLLIFAKLLSQDVSQCL